MKSTIIKSILLTAIILVACGSDVQQQPMGNVVDYTTDLPTCVAERNNCSQAYGECAANFKTCRERAGKCSAQQNTCIHDRDVCTAERTVCEEERDACTTDLRTRTSERDACVSDRDECVEAHATCEEDLEAFEDNQYRDAGTVDSTDLFSTMCSSTNSNRILPSGDLGVFQDSKFGGQSRVWWRMNRSCAVGTTGSGCCFELNYRFVAGRMSTYTPYAGVMAHFTYIPYGPIDVSGYDGLGMLAHAEPTVGSAPRISVQLADIGPNTGSEASISSCRDGFFDAPVFEFGAAPSILGTVNLNFTDFARPSWYTCSRTTALQTARIYKLAIVLLNTSSTETALEGKVVFSNLHFR